MAYGTFNRSQRLVEWSGRCQPKPPEGAEQRLKELAIKLPVPPRPFGTYVEGVQTGELLFLTGMLLTEGRGAKFIGRVGAARLGGGAQVGSPRCTQCPRCCEAAFGIARQSDAGLRLDPRFSEEILRSVRQKLG